MSDDLNFDLILQELPVTLTNADGVAEQYVLRELTGRGRDQYLNNLTGRLVTDAKGNSRMKDFTGLQSNLVGRCLFRKDGQAVTEAELVQWPARVLSKLFDKAKELSGLDDDAEEEAGNE